MLSGGRYVTVSAPLDRIPLFVRYGALIPVLADPGESVGDGPFGEITPVAYGVGTAAAARTRLTGLLSGLSDCDLTLPETWALHVLHP